MASLPNRIILTGFSGTGKTAVGPLLARELGWELVDTDRLVEERAGKRILEIFRDDGETAFRELEIAALRDACARNGVVVSTGGGVVLSPDNRRVMAEGGLVVCLEARPATILERLVMRAEDAPLDRPLLATEDPLPRIKDLKHERQHLYVLCDWSVHTDGLTPEEVTAEIVRAYRGHGAAMFAAAGRVEAMADPEATASPKTLHAIPEGAACMVQTALREYPVFVGWGILRDLGQRMRDAGLSNCAYVISDQTVWHHLGDEVAAALTAADFEFDSYTVSPGEGSKSLENAAGIYDWLIEHRAERGHTIVAIGGGVATDLGGYVASTFARGLPLVQVPTSMLGQVDASIGGKVAVNHPKAKNMIGVFYQPRLVLADVATLRTLPPREIKSGLAEAIKHAMIADESYLEFFERKASAILRLDQAATVEAIRRSVCIKADVVGEDEFETKGRRSHLNYGHTLAHAIEATTGYSRFRHGEADAIGMMAVASMSVQLGMMPAEVKERQRRVLEQYGLPTHADDLDRGRIMQAIALDKKVQARKVRWVLLEGIGKPVVRDDVPDEVVQSALDEVLH